MVIILDGKKIAEKRLEILGGEILNSGLVHNSQQLSWETIPHPGCISG